MQDFFTRFPNLPFGNMKSFKFLHDRGSMPVSNTLISEEDHDYPFHDVRKRKNIFSKKPKMKTGDKKMTVTVKEVQSTTTRATTYKGKHRLLFSKRKSTKSYMRKTTARPSTATTLDRVKYYNDFNIVSTTPTYDQVNQLPKYGKSKIEEMRKSFYFYEDKFSSQHFIYPNDDFFATQLDKPKLVAEQQFFAYDPFRQNMKPTTSRPEDTTLEKHFYYGDTKHMYKSRSKKTKKKGIVINEKAASGEVNVEEPEDHTEPPAPMITEAMTTTTSSTSTPSTTTKTTTLSPTSVSQLPKLRSKTKLYHYRHPNTGLMYSPLLYRPLGLLETPPTSSPQKRKYTYTTVTTHRPKYELAVTDVVVMPPYTPAPAPSNTTTPTTTTTTTTSEVYFTPEYSSEDFSQYAADYPETETAGEQGDIGDNNETSHGQHKKYSYKYKVLQGQVHHVTGSDPPPPPHQMYPVRIGEPPAPHHHHLPPPPPPPPRPPSQVYPYPFYKPYQYPVSQYNPYDTNGYTYHSKIRYRPEEKEEEEEEPILKYKYSTPVRVSKAAPKKYLPHNQIIKATFFEDKEQDEEKVDNTEEDTGEGDETKADSGDETLAKETESEGSKSKTRFKRKKHPLYRKPYRKDKMMYPKSVRNIDRSDEDHDDHFGDQLFRANLKKIMENQFFIHPSDFLSGFVPVQSEREKPRKYAGHNGNLEKVNSVNTKINVSLKPSSVRTPTTKSPLSTTNLFTKDIDKNKLERWHDLQNNYHDINKRKGKQSNLKEDSGLLSLILKKYGNAKNNAIDNEVPEKKPRTSIRPRLTEAPSASPVQSIKENLVSRFLQHFTKEPLVVKKKSAETLVEEVRAPNAGRLPQSFIRDFEKKGTKGTSPPSSQDSYKNFLRKLRERGRNES